jgi:hypothetical protein
MTNEKGPKTVEDMTIEELREAYTASERQAFDLQMRLQGQLMSEARREREIAAVVRRSAMEDTVARQDHYLYAELSKRLGPFNSLVYRIEQLGERASNKQVAALKSAARDVRYVLTLRRDQKPDTKLADLWETEARRLRVFIVAQGRALHQMLAPERTGGCNCQGCDLIRGMDMDVAELPAVAS